MSTLYTKITDIQLLQENSPGVGSWQMALVAVDIPAFTTSDTVVINGCKTGTSGSGSDTLATAIQNARRDGKTVTIYAGQTICAGYNAAGTASYLVGATGGGANIPLVVSSGTFTGVVAGATGTVANFTVGSTVPTWIAVSYSIA